MPGLRKLPTGSRIDAHFWSAVTCHRFRRLRPVAASRTEFPGREWYRVVSRFRRFEDNTVECSKSQEVESFE